MKQILLYTFLLLCSWTGRSQIYHKLTIYEDVDKTTEFVTQEIDSITFDNNKQRIWTKDSVFVLPISEPSMGIISPMAMDAYLLKTDNIGDWSEMRVSRDGSLLMIKNYDDTSVPKEIFSIVPDYQNEDGLLFIHSNLDEIGRPQTIQLNDCLIHCDSYQDNYANMTIVLHDTLIYSVDSVLITPTDPSLRAANENNWQRNLSAGLEAAAGVLSVGGGALLIAGSIVGEFGTVGASTPISVAGIAEGSLMIAGGAASINSAWQKLYMPGAHHSNVGETLYFQAAGTLIGNAPQSPYIPDQYWPYLKEPNNYKALNAAGWLSFFVGLTGGVLDNMYGATVTSEQLKAFYQGKAMTGIYKDRTPYAATVRGYITPSITRSFLDGSKNETEYGIVLYSSLNSADRQIKKETNGDGGMIEYTFTDLQPETTYYYRTYFVDKTNGISLLGDLKSFATLTTATVGYIEIREPNIQGVGRINFKAVVRVNEFEDSREGVIGYGFGLFSNGKLVKDYTIENFDDFVPIELECDTTNLTLDWDNFVATTKGHWTIAKSVRYESDGKEYVSYFTDSMQDVVLTYDSNPWLMEIMWILGAKQEVVSEDENGDPYYCKISTAIDYNVRGLFWGDQIQLHFLEWSGADAIQYTNPIENPTTNPTKTWKIDDENRDYLIMFNIYYYSGSPVSCRFQLEHVLANGKRLLGRQTCHLYRVDDENFILDWRFIEETKSVQPDL